MVGDDIGRECPSDVFTFDREWLWICTRGRFNFDRALCRRTDLGEGPPTDSVELMAAVQAPLLVMRLGDGLRLAATRDVSKHVSFALRRNTLGKVTLADLVGRRMLSPVVADLLRACMRSSEIRLVFSGPTGSGKTTLVRACLGELPAHARVVIIEDTAEIDLFDPVLHPNVESWEARLANSEGEGAITQGQEVKHALRYAARLAGVR